ncbi:Leucine rich adaptor protein 1-like [Branchiostoma belcheri]|nr:Leucine rich adaptor protein 1-like [Branchiostoma belcheri]
MSPAFVDKENIGLPARSLVDITRRTRDSVRFRVTPAQTRQCHLCHPCCVEWFVQVDFVRPRKQIRQADIRLMHTFLAVNEGIEELKWLMDNSLHTPTSSMCSSLASLVDSRDVLNTISEEGAGFSPESPMRIRRNSDPGCRGGDHDHDHDQSSARSQQRRESDQTARTIKFGDISPQQLPTKIRYGLSSPGSPHRRLDPSSQAAPFEKYLMTNGSVSTGNTKCKDLASAGTVAQGTEDNWTLLV